MSQQTVYLQSSEPQKMLRAQEAANANFTELYSNIGIGVPLSRTLTINGVAQDLSADRTWTVSGGTTTFIGLTDAPASYAGQTLKLVRVNAAESALEFLAPTTAFLTDSTNKRFVTDAQQVVIGNTSGTNTGDQTLAGLGGLTHQQTLARTLGA